ncbi:MAG: hypothetical protein ACYC1D_20170 [Acidimicrobiales bacterium]
MAREDLVARTFAELAERAPRARSTPRDVEAPDQPIVAGLTALALREPLLAAVTG